MNRRAVLIIAALVILAGLVWWALRPGGPRLISPGVTVEALPTPTPAPEQRIMLLFPGPDGRLHPVLRTVALPAELDQRARVVVRELLKGPGGRADLLAAVPWPCELLEVFVDGRGAAYVDLTGPEAPLAGSNVELMTAYSIVNSVLLNCPELHRLQILLDGKEIPTLTGHLDLSKPLTVNKGLIASS